MARGKHARNPKRYYTIRTTQSTGGRNACKGFVFFFIATYCTDQMPAGYISICCHFNRLTVTWDLEVEL